MRRRSVVVPTLVALAVGLAGCAKKQQTRGPGKREVAGVRARSADAFADLEAAERGEPAPLPKARPEVDEGALRPRPKPAEPKREVARKSVDSVPVNPARAAPDWVGSQPRMSGYYVGIGVSTSHGDEAQDWARARNHAYVELASTLKVHIRSAISDYFKENNLRLYEKDNITKDTTRQDAAYTEDTQFFVDQTLQGVEIYDRWKDAEQNKYWMLVRLSKAEIARRIRQRLERARKKAVDHVLAARKAEAAGHIGQAFRGYFQSYLALRAYFGGVVEHDVDGDGKNDVLNHEIERAVHRLAAKLDWRVDQPKRRAVNGGGLAEPLAVAIDHKGKPVVNLPVAFAFQRGRGAIEGKVATGSDGVATARVMKVFGDKQAIIGARVDVTALVDRDREARVVDAKFHSSIELKTGKFFVELEELSAFIQITEELLGEELSPGTIATDVKDRLHAELGLVFTKASGGADLEIRGQAVVGDCSEFFAQRQCTARVNVTVTDRLKGRQLFSKKYKVAGNGENDREAGRAALSKVGRRLAKKIIEAMQ